MFVHLKALREMITEEVFVMYNLRPGVKFEDYKRWSHTLDRVTTPFQPGVIRFEVYQITGALEGEPTCQIVEDVEMDSWEAFQALLTGEDMKQVMAEWGNYADSASLKIIHGTKV